MIQDAFEGCIIAGAIGDAWGSSYEQENQKEDASTFYLAPKQAAIRQWRITDDTQLTLATCEVLAEGLFTPERLASKFVAYYRSKKLSGVGASTLKAIVDHEAGFHWKQAARSGTFAAGNGAAMRIAPFAFYPGITNNDIFDACSVTHRNDEAYAGALAVYLAVKAALFGDWTGTNNLFNLIIPQLPDTIVRDRLIAINNFSGSESIADIAALGNNGYVVNSIPFALYCASQMPKIGLKAMYEAIIQSGGDTDTNASIAGQIAGALLGIDGIPEELHQQLKTLQLYPWMESIIKKSKATFT